MLLPGLPREFGIIVKWTDLEFLVLTDFVSAAQTIVTELREARKAGRMSAKVHLPKQARLRDCDLW